ncbi:MAG: acyltransferase, partial [Bacteroidota bacterium]|nr:acyltransferase [Bacteroidota bacterium]
KKGSVDAMAELFTKYDTLRLIITPEGTRSRREKWKTGFYHVAMKAKVPIALGFMDYEKKECGIDKIIYPSGDYKKDMKIIMDFYKNIKAKYPENFSVDTELSK